MFEKVSKPIMYGTTVLDGRFEFGGRNKFVRRIRRHICPWIIGPTWRGRMNRFTRNKDLDRVIFNELNQKTPYPTLNTACDQYLAKKKTLDFLGEYSCNDH